MNGEKQVKRLLTVQDISCVGQCSTTVALPIISACGVECGVLPPAILSNHTAAGFSGWTFADLAGEMPKIEERWKIENIKFDAFYTGYVCESHIDPILSIIRSCSNPFAIRIVDPAMADGGNLYAGFAPDFPSKMSRLCEGADYLLPNMTEALFLVGEKVVLPSILEKQTEKEIESLIGRLHEIGASTIVLTGVSLDGVTLGTAVSDGKNVKYDFNPRNPRSSHGTGDVFASVFSGAVVRGMPADKAAELAADFVCECIEATSADHWYGVSFERALPSLIERFRAV